LIKIGIEREKDLRSAIEWVKRKIEKAEKKLTLPEAREIIKEKYEAIKLIFPKDSKP